MPRHTSTYPKIFKELLLRVEAGHFKGEICVPLPEPVSPWAAKTYANQWRYYGKSLQAEGYTSLAQNHGLLTVRAPKNAKFVIFALRDEDPFALALKKALEEQQGPFNPHKVPKSASVTLNTDSDPYAEPQDPFADYFK